MAAKMVGRRGVIIAGRGESDPDDVLALAAALGWPVIADHRSGCRRPGVGIRHFDALLRQPEFVAANRPDVILRLGEIMSSKAVSQWLTATDAVVVSAMPWGRTIDPEGVADTIVPEAGLVRQLLAALHSPVDDGLAAAWADADRRAATAIDAVLAEEPGSEVAITRAAMNAVPAGGALVLSSSMPVRDAEWYGPNRDDIDVYSNRGANGIDGVISTAIGIALGGRPTICLLGDVALLHDSNGLIGLAERDVDLTIVVIDNDGGGIFSFLPQHELLDDDRYELLFGTPHGVDLIALATAVGVEAAPFDPAAVPPAGARVLVARSDRAANLELHNRLNTAVGDAIRG